MVTSLDLNRLAGSISVSKCYFFKLSDCSLINSIYSPIITYITPHLFIHQRHYPLCMSFIYPDNQHTKQYVFVIPKLIHAIVKYNSSRHEYTLIKQMYSHIVYTMHQD